MPITKQTNKFTKIKQLTDADILSAGGSSSTTESFGINYIDNFNAETDASDWATYDDASETSDDSRPYENANGGTGGSPAVTFARIPSTNLRGTALFRFTKDAANRQGQGFSTDFTIADADKAKPLSISFEYQVSANFVAGYASDIRVWILDVTNGRLIQPAPYTIQGGAIGTHKFLGTFQTSADSTSYRLIFHIATVNANAWTFDLDTIVVGPQTVSYGAAITDWKEYPLVITGSTTNPTKGTIVVDKAFWRRVGDSMEITYVYRQSSVGTAGSGSYRFSIPSGYSADLTNKIFTAGLDNTPVIGSGSVGTNTSFPDRPVSVFVSTATTLGLMLLDPTKDVVGSGNESLALTANQKYTFFARIPITGWSSNVEMSNDTDTRVVAMAMNNVTPSGTLSASYNDVNWPTAAFDTHGAMGPVNYTIPVSGIYCIGSFIKLDGTDGSNGFVSMQFIRTLVGGGTQISTADYPPDTVGSQATWVANHTAMFKCDAGDTLKVQVKENLGAEAYLSGNSSLFIYRLSGPSAIAASETVVARYAMNAASNIDGTGGTPRKIDFNIKDFDSHGAVTGTGSGIGGTWKFTAPVSGTYEISGTIRYANGTSWAANSYIGLNLFKNDISIIVEDEIIQTAFTNTNIGPRVRIAAKVKLLAGEFIDLRTYHGEGAVNRALFASAVHNWVEISRIGNY